MVNGLIITPVLAAALGLILAALSLHVIRLRYRERVSLGDGGSPDLLRAMRVQANFAEHAPLALVLLVILEINQEQAAVLYGFGAALVLGRCLHAFGFSRPGAHFIWRSLGMFLTFAVLIGASLRLAAAALGA